MKIPQLILCMGSLLLISCGGEPRSPESENTQAQEAKTVDEKKGIGLYTHVELSTPIDQEKVKKGKGVYDLKCSACHHLDNTKLVGPGWKDVTKRRKPEWIMNFVTNPDENLNRDPQAAALLEECLVRMPNQNLTEADARSVLEFMRHNDGEQ